MVRRKPKRPRHQPAAQTHRVARSYTNSRRWHITEEPKEQEVPALGEGRRWYVVRVGAKREAANEQRLREDGFQTFVPRYVRTAKREKQRVVTERILIPGYVFVASDASDAEQSRIIGANPNRVECEILRSRATLQPIFVPESVMARFAGLASKATAAETDATRPVLVIGSTVTFADGPFRTFSAIVESVDGDMAHVLMDMLGQMTPVMIPIAALEPS